MVRRNFGSLLDLDPLDSDDFDSSARIGERIKAIRIARGLTQAQLGKMLKLGADRVQQYETGYRTPKKDLLKKIASALGVSTLALVDPVIINNDGAMYSLFDLEKKFNLKVVKNDDGEIVLSFSDDKSGNMNSLLEEWYKESIKVKEAIDSASTEEEKKAIALSYENWKWNFSKIRRMSFAWDESSEIQAKFKDSND